METTSPKVNQLKTVFETRENLPIKPLNIEELGKFTIKKIQEFLFDMKVPYKSGLKKQEYINLYLEASQGRPLSPKFVKTRISAGLRGTVSEIDENHLYTKEELLKLTRDAIMSLLDKKKITYKKRDSKAQLIALYK